MSHVNYRSRCSVKKVNTSSRSNLDPDELLVRISISQRFALRIPLCATEAAFWATQQRIVITWRRKVPCAAHSRSGLLTVGNEILPCTGERGTGNPPAFATGLRFPPAAEWRDLAQLWQSHRQRGRHPSSRLLRGTTTARHYFWNNAAMLEKRAGLW